MATGLRKWLCTSTIILSTSPPRSSAPSPPLLVPVLAADPQLIEHLRGHRNLNPTSLLELQQLSPHEEGQNFEMFEAHPDRGNRLAGNRAASRRGHGGRDREVQGAAEGANVECHLVRIHINRIWHRLLLR